jgi:neurofibromin 1
VDVSDVYNISTGFDPNEFIIRRIRHGVTLYFSSPQRDTIIKVDSHLFLIVLVLMNGKCIRSAKGMMKNVQLIGTERYSRLSNVSATLLHIGMFSSGCEDDDLRQAGFELVGAVCGYLDYDGPMAMIPVRGGNSFLLLNLSYMLIVRSLLITTIEFPCYRLERTTLRPCSTTDARLLERRSSRYGQS